MRRSAFGNPGSLDKGYGARLAGFPSDRAVTTRCTEYVCPQGSHRRQLLGGLSRGGARARPTPNRGRSYGAGGNQSFFKDCWMQSKSAVDGLLR